MYDASAQPFNVLNDMKSQNYKWVGARENVRLQIISYLRLQTTPVYFFETTILSEKSYEWLGLLPKPVLRVSTKTRYITSLCFKCGC